MVEAYLTRKARSAWPDAAVFKEPDGSFTLERPDLEALQLGPAFPAAKGALLTLIGYKPAQRETVAHRRPFLEVFPTRDVWRYSIGAGCLGRRPELAALVGQCIEAWNNIELQMGLALGALLKAESQAAVEAFLAIRRSGSQKDVIASVARVQLTGQDLEVCLALLTLYAGETSRNDLAHGIYGCSDDDPDVLLWTSIADHGNFLINIYAAEHRGELVEDPHDQLREKMWVYTKADLERALADLKELCQATQWFHLRHKSRGEESSLALKRMLRMPQVVEAVARLKRKNPG